MGIDRLYVLCARTKGKPSRRCPNVVLRWRKPLPLRELMPLYLVLVENGLSAWFERKED